MEKLRPAVKNGNGVKAECPIGAECEYQNDEGLHVCCGFLVGYLTDKRGMKARCLYREEDA